MNIGGQKMPEFDVHEKRTKEGDYALFINLKEPANSVVATPYPYGVPDLEKIFEDFRAMGYSCTVNFKSERIVCVR